MVSEDAATKVLEYIKKQGQSNTFRLASELGIDRSRILNIVKKLEEKQVVEVHAGIVKFLKFPRKEKKPKKLKVKKPSKPKKRAKCKKTILENLKAENKRLKGKLLELKKAPPKVIRRRVKAPPKIIRKTVTKKVPVIKRIHIGSKKLKEQAEYIKELEEKIKELQKKASKPKIIRRTIVKEVPKIIRKTIVKKVPVKVKEKIEPKKFKIPKFLIKPKRPKPKKPKIKKRKSKIFAKLNKNLQKLHVPEIFKK